MTGLGQTGLGQPRRRGNVVVPLNIVSVEDTVYGMLRREIGQLRFAPNERLRLEDLAARYEVSLTPVRQALRRLESDGLVVSQSRRGTHVSPLTVEEIEEIQMVRIGLETWLAARGAERCTDATIERMIEQRLQMEAAYEQDDFWSFVSCFWSFRDICYERAGRPRLMAAVAHQRMKVERYLVYLCRDVESAALLREPPDQLLDACRAQDAETAERSTRVGLVWVLERLSALLEAADATGARTA